MLAHKRPMPYCAKGVRILFLRGFNSFEIGQIYQRPEHEIIRLLDRARRENA